MKKLLAVAAIVLGLVLVPSVESATLHNVPPIVEQQGIGIWACYFSDPTGDYSDCVTNATDWVWDADDSVNESAQGIWNGDLYADWTEHDYSALVCDYKRNARKQGPLTLTFNFDPPHPRREPQLVYTETFTPFYSKRTECVRACVKSPDYDRDMDLDKLQTIPSQGGGGMASGLAVPTHVTILTSHPAAYVNVKVNLSATPCGDADG